MAYEEEDYVPVNVDILRVTPRAVQARCADNVPRWIPRSLIFGPHEKTLESRIGQLAEIRVMRWYAVKETVPLARGSR